MRQSDAVIDEEEQAKIKELWDTYRLGKSFPCASDMIQELIQNRPDKKIQKRRQDYPEKAMGKEPRPGSESWITTIDPPPYFVVEMQHDQVVITLRGDRR